MRHTHLGSFAAAFALILVLGAIPTPDAQAQVAGHWEPLLSPEAPARWRHSAAFDSARQQMVVFGGDGDFSGTWIWNGENWFQAATQAQSPPARGGHAMTFDRARNVVVLHGGANGSTILSDTWEWDGVAWTLRPAAGGPLASGHTLAFDVARQRTVLFGGYRATTETGVVDSAQTWEYDGTSWTLVASPDLGDLCPAPRRGHCSAYDIVRGRTIVYGGYSNDFLGETWEWDGNNWTQIASTPNPDVRSDAAMAFDELEGVTIMTGGSPDFGRTQTWSLCADGWKLLDSVEHQNRFEHTLVYDTARSRVLSFGGNGPTGLLANLQAFLTPQVATMGTGLNGSGLAVAVVPDASRQVLVGGSFTTAGGVSVANIASWDGTAWTPLGSGLNSTVNAVIAAPGPGGMEYFAGGAFSASGAASMSRVARWDGSAWNPMGAGLNGTVRALALFPSATGPTRIVAGGSFNSTTTLLNYVALWNGTAWEPLASGLNGQVNAVVVVPNNANGHDIIVGGSFTAAGTTQTLRVARWDGTSWSQVGDGLNGTVNALAVLPRTDGGFDIIAGGAFNASGATSVSRVARWNGTSWQPIASGLNSTVSALAVSVEPNGQPDIFAGGSFTASGTQPALRLARFDGTSWQQIGAGADGTVSAIALSDFGCGVADAFFAGSFLNSGTLPVSRVARLKTVGWQNVNPAFPEARFGRNFARDSSRNRFVLFSGPTVTGLADDTWEFDGTRWTRRNIASPGVRFRTTMVFDSIRNRMVVYGGVATNGESALSTTLEYDGIAWTTRSISGPGPKQRYGACFDSTRGRVVMFGGTNASTTVNNQTWEFDGTTWTQRTVATPVPSARRYPAMCFDPVRNEVVLFGGSTGSASLADTWIWNGSEWIQRSVSGPPARELATLSWDSIGQRMVLFGGINSSGATFGDAWEWNGSRWASIDVGGPAARSVHGADFDPVSGRVIMFGGTTGNLSGQSLGDLWALSSGCFEVTPSNDQDACPGDIVEFSVVSSSPSPTFYQWQHRAPGSSDWNNIATSIPDVGTFAGATTNQLVVSNLGPLADDSFFRCIVNAPCDSIASFGSRLNLLDVGCCPTCAADYDNNGGVDGGDLAAFFADFEAGEGCADVDLNGGVDGGDLAFFFALFEAGGC